MGRTLYDILEVSKTAPPEVIKSSYRALAAMYHPDNGPSADEEKFKLIVRAYGVLSDPEKRAEYDSRILHGEEEKFLGFGEEGESLVPKSVKRLDGSDTWCTIDEHVRRKGMELANTDLTGLCLKNLSLEGAQIGNSDLNLVDFEDISLSKADISGVVCEHGLLKNVDFSEANLNGSKFISCVFLNCNFSECCISDACFRSSDFRGSSFANTSLNKVDFSDCILEEMFFSLKSNRKREQHGYGITNCTFRRANLINSNFLADPKVEKNYSESNDDRLVYYIFHIENTDFTGANLSGSNLSYTFIKNCNFSKCLLSSAKFYKSRIKSLTSFVDSGLYGADFTQATIYDADFTTCNLLNVRFHQSRLVNVTFPKGYAPPQSAKIDW